MSTNPRRPRLRPEKGFDARGGLIVRFEQFVDTALGCDAATSS